jgi:uncharacterized membrane protein
MSRRTHPISRWILTIFMVLAGVNHFLSPAPYVGMMPAALPAPWALVYISGIAEILGGLGLIRRATRRHAAWWLIALFIAIFPANLNMAVNHLALGDHALPDWMLWARLPLQGVLIWWAAAFTHELRSEPVIDPTGGGPPPRRQNRRGPHPPRSGFADRARRRDEIS